HAHIQSGRDYFDNTQKPGYTPYTYPHPLITDGTTSKVIINVYPNPCRVYRGEILITFENLNTGSEIKIFDISGKIVYNSGNITGYSHRWNVRDISSGVYYYNIRSDVGRKKTCGEFVIIR
ncbi:T9SS type A sorting domain-containing protein, partial [candidate division WOR-3 bacterium]|nr:T9SS type A sorting domain-containing protein [candidate division WOR-3 bacterium]